MAPVDILLLLFTPAFLVITARKIKSFASFQNYALPTTKCFCCLFPIWCSQQRKKFLWKLWLRHQQSCLSDTKSVNTCSCFSFLVNPFLLWQQKYYLPVSLCTKINTEYDNRYYFHKSIHFSVLNITILWLAEILNDC